MPFFACPTVPPEIAETVKLASASASVSFAKTPLLTWSTSSVASSLTAPVSLTPTGSSSTPVIVIVI